MSDAAAALWVVYFHQPTTPTEETVFGPFATSKEASDYASWITQAPFWGDGYVVAVVPLSEPRRTR